MHLATVLPISKQEFPAAHTHCPYPLPYYRFPPRSLFPKLLTKSSFPSLTISSTPPQHEAPPPHPPHRSCSRGRCPHLTRWYAVPEKHPPHTPSFPKDHINPFPRLTHRIHPRTQRQSKPPYRPHPRPRPMSKTLRRKPSSLPGGAFTGSFPPPPPLYYIAAIHNKDIVDEAWD